MCKNVLITGVTVAEQMKAAREILINEVIPRENAYQRKKREGKLSEELKKALSSDA